MGTHTITNYSSRASEKVKPWSQTGLSGRNLSRFPLHEAARSISTPSGRDASRARLCPNVFPTDLRGKENELLGHSCEPLKYHLVLIALQ